MVVCTAADATYQYRYQLQAICLLCRWYCTDQAGFIGLLSRARFSVEPLSLLVLQGRQTLLICTMYIPSRQTTTPLPDTFGLALQTMYSFPLRLTTLQESHSFLMAERTRIALWVLLDSVVHQRNIDTNNGKQLMHRHELTPSPAFASAVLQGDGSLCYMGVALSDAYALRSEEFIVDVHQTSDQQDIREPGQCTDHLLRAFATK